MATPRADKSAWWSRGGDAAAFALKIGGGFDFGARDKIDCIAIGRTGDERHVAAFDARRYHRFGARSGEWYRAAHDHGCDQGPAVDVYGFDSEAVLGKRLGALLGVAQWKSMIQREKIG